MNDEWMVCKNCPHLLRDKDGNYCGHNHEDGTITEHNNSYLDCPLIKMDMENENMNINQSEIKKKDYFYCHYCNSEFCRSDMVFDCICPVCDQTIDMKRQRIISKTYKNELGEYIINYLYQKIDSKKH